MSELTPLNVLRQNVRWMVLKNIKTTIIYSSGQLCSSRKVRYPRCVWCFARYGCHWKDYSSLFIVRSSKIGGLIFYGNWLSSHYTAGFAMSEGSKFGADKSTRRTQLPQTRSNSRRVSCSPPPIGKEKLYICMSQLAIIKGVTLFTLIPTSNTYKEDFLIDAIPRRCPNCLPFSQTLRIW